MKLRKINLTLITLILIAILGGFFRFYNLNWDQGYFFNPDESNNIARPAAGLGPSFHPGNFTYGSLTIYLYRGGAEVMSFLTQDQTWLQAERINLVGRFFSGLFSLSLIFLVFWLGRKLFSDKVGLLAAGLTALNVGLIQASHFGTTETILALTGILIMTAIVFLKTKRYQFGYFLAGLTLGLGTAAKISALVFLPPFLASHWLFLAKRPFSIKKFWLLVINKNTFLKRNLWLIISLALMGFVFFIVSPYALLDFPIFKESFEFQNGIATGKVPVFFTRQFQETIPWLFQIRQVLPWLTTWPVLILAFFGAGLAFFQGFRQRNFQKTILVFLPSFYFLYNGSLFVKWTRYMVPLMPFVCLLAAVFLIGLYRRFKKKGFVRNMVLGVILAVLLFQFGYTLAFFRIYRLPDTRIAASEWLYQNLPPKSQLLLEPLDVVSLPLPTPKFQPSLYQQDWFDFYAFGDSHGQKRTKLTKELADKLAKADYVIIGSRRLWANHLRLKNQHPASAQYYLSLFNGNLGFEKIKEFSSSPQILGIKINDDLAEETFQVFDHPRVIVFQKTKELKIDQYLKILQL